MTRLINAWCDYATENEWRGCLIVVALILLSLPVCEKIAAMIGGG